MSAIIFLTACGDDQRNPPLGPAILTVPPTRGPASPAQAASAATSSPADAATDHGKTTQTDDLFCIEYCNTIVQRPGCTTYNDGNRCVDNCRFYKLSLCMDEFRAFGDCVLRDRDVRCQDDGSGGYLALIVGVTCEQTFLTWDKCATEKKAGGCDKPGL